MFKTESSYNTWLDGSVGFPTVMDSSTLENKWGSSGVFFWFSGYSLERLKLKHDGVAQSFDYHCNDDVSTNTELNASDNVPDIPADEVMRELVAVEENLSNHKFTASESNRFLLEGCRNKSIISSGTYYKLNGEYDDEEGSDVPDDPFPDPPSDLSRPSTVASCYDMFFDKQIQPVAEPVYENLPTVVQASISENEPDLSEDDGKWFSLRGLSFRRKNKSQASSVREDVSLDQDAIAVKGTGVVVQPVYSDLKLGTNQESGGLVGEPLNMVLTEHFNQACPQSSPSIIFDEDLEMLSEIIGKFEEQTTELAELLKEEDMKKYADDNVSKDDHDLSDSVILTPNVISYDFKNGSICTSGEHSENQQVMSLSGKVFDNQDFLEYVGPGEAAVLSTFLANLQQEAENVEPHLSCEVEKNLQNEANFNSESHGTSVNLSEFVIELKDRKVSDSMCENEVFEEPAIQDEEQNVQSALQENDAGFVSCEDEDVHAEPESPFKRSTSFRRSIVIEDEVGDKKKSPRKSSVCVSVFFTPILPPMEAVATEPAGNSACSELNGILTYISQMPLNQNSFSKSYDAVKRLSAIFWELKDKDRLNDSPSELLAVLNYMVVQEWPKVFLGCMKKLKLEYAHVFLECNDPESIIYYSGHMPSSLRMNRTTVEFAVAVVFDSLLKAAVNFTDVHDASRQACCEEGLVGWLLDEICPHLHNIQWGKSTAREMFLKSAMALLYNCATSASNTSYLMEKDAVDMLTGLRYETEDVVDARSTNIVMLLTLSFLMDDTNYDVIVPQEDTIILLLQCLDSALEHSEHKYYNFSVKQLTEGLSRLASHNANKVLIARNSGQEILHKVLKFSYSDDEKVAACNCLWNLSFCKEAKDIVRGMNKLMILLRDLKGHDNVAVRRAASGVIWENEDKYDIKGIRDPYTMADRHVVLSFESESEPLMITVRDELQTHGFRVWMETDSTDRSVQDAMSQGVERASLVIVAVTRRYKQMPHSYAVGDYAQRLRKPMFGIKLEDDFYPEGWLGELLESGTWVDFSRKSALNGSLDALLRHAKLIAAAEPSCISADIIVGSSMTRARSADVLTWGNDDVIEWLKENKLIRSVSNSGRLEKLRGLHLLMLYDLKKESPDYYYTALDSHLGFKDVLDTLEFTYALDRLLESATKPPSSE